MEDNQKDQKRKDQGRTESDDTKSGTEKTKGAQIAEEKDEDRLNTTSDPIAPKEHSRHFNETLGREDRQDDRTIPGATPID